MMFRNWGVGFRAVFLEETAEGQGDEERTSYPTRPPGERDRVSVSVKRC